MSRPEVEALLRAAVAAASDHDRAVAARSLEAVPGVLGIVAAMLTSDVWDERELALHFVTRLGAPPAELAPAVIRCLRAPAGDPLGDEMALVLVATGLYASEVFGFRDALVARVRAVENADGPRRPVMMRLAHETLAKIDAAARASDAAFAADVARIVARVEVGQLDEASALCEQQSAEGFYPELGRAARWERAAGALTGEARRFCLDRALHEYERHASGATSGGEGLARMIDVERLRRMV